MNCGTPWCTKRHFQASAVCERGYDGEDCEGQLGGPSASDLGGEIDLNGEGRNRFKVMLALPGRYRGRQRGRHVGLAFLRLLRYLRV